MPGKTLVINLVQLKAHTRVKSAAHVTVMALDTVGDNLQRLVMSTGRPGRLGSTLGLLVGITF